MGIQLAQQLHSAHDLAQPTSALVACKALSADLTRFALQMGTHLRAKRKRDEMGNYIRRQKK